jgi:hypothetical protein
MFLAEAMGVLGVSSLFCFERDPHGLYSLPFQKAKMLPKIKKQSLIFLEGMES